MVISEDLKKKSGIYKLIIANHVYIGSSINLYKRLLVHNNELLRNKHSNTHLQRCVNKYGFDKLSYEIKAIVPNASKKLLLALEKFFIDFENADLNFKMDPRTEENCITTSVPVYQFNAFGELEISWPSISEAARHFNIDVSNIVICCKNPNRQQYAAGHLWSYESKYPYSIRILYVFDLEGNYINRFANTSEIANMFPDVKRKTILSQLNKKIDSDIPYKNIYISTNKDYKIPQNYIPKYRKPDEYDTVFEGNPIIYVFDLNNNLQYSKCLLDFDDPNYVKRKIRSGSVTYRLQKDTIQFNKGKGVEATKDGKTIVFNSAVEASFKLFGNVSYAKNICKHIKWGTPYKNYYFKRVL